MTSVTRASLAYICTQVSLSLTSLVLALASTHLSKVRFSLTSTNVFSRSDSETDTKTFYNSILDLLEDPEEQEEVKDLLCWWDK